MNTAQICLYRIAQPLFFDGPLIRQLDEAILSDDELADTASAELHRIRRQILRENDGIREKLSSLIRSTAHKDHLQDAIVTMRGGRYVVPVKQEYKKSVKGPGARPVGQRADGVYRADGSGGGQQPVARAGA